MRQAVALLLAALAEARAEWDHNDCVGTHSATAMEGTIVGRLTPEAAARNARLGVPSECAWHVAPQRSLQFIEFNTSQSEFVGQDHLSFYTGVGTTVSQLLSTFSGKGVVEATQAPQQDICARTARAPSLMPLSALRVQRRGLSRRKWC